MSELFDINYYCRIYDNFLDDEICDTYVQYFEETLEKDADEVKKTSICIGRTRPDGHQICGNCNCQRLNPMGFSRFDYFNDIAIKKFQQATEQYKKDISLKSSQWPKEYGWEELRMKRFLVSDGGIEAEQFGLHVDVNNLEGAKRFLIFMVYLNDDFEGGETEFPIFGDKVKPKKGRLLMFPPFWTYLHRGNPPLKPGGYAKYFLMTYLNYTE